MKTPLVLIDGSSYFFRAFHALPPLTNSKGQPTGAIYGVVNMVKRLIKDYKPEQLIIIFDAEGKTFRDEWYPAYKATRSATPPELRSQFQPLISIIKAMGIPVMIIDGVEADDVIGSLVHQACEKKIPVLVSTSDKDIAQLVNDHVTLINTMTQQILDEDGVFKKFGIKPQQMIDYLTLTGDASDNIPGVTKCGPKTAVKWLTEYQTLDNLIAHAHEIKGKIGEYLRACIPNLDLSKRLVTIKTDLELPLMLEELSIQPPDHQELLKWATELEFKAWSKEWSNAAPPSAAPAPKDSKMIQKEQELSEALQSLNNTNKFSFYIDPAEEKLYFALNATISVCIDLKAFEETLFTQLKPVFENHHIQKIGHNLKQSFAWLQTKNIQLQGQLFDVMLESYVLNSTAGRHDLNTLINTYIPTSSADIAAMIYQLHEIFFPNLSETLQAVFYTLEMPLIPILADMEYYGVLIDFEQLASQGKRLVEKIKMLEQEAYQLAGHAFNLNSPKQLLEILYNEQKLPILAKTPTGQPSTGESVLQELAFQYRLPAVLLEYRSLSKLISTYIDALPKRMNAHTQRVHTSYNQAITATGRLSSSDPNLQNIPIRNAEGRLIRKAFIAPKHHVLMTADYSQIELRIMAHLSHDPQLQYAFAKGWDIHTATASEIFSVPLDAVDQEQRRRAKAVNFGLIYGMSSFGLAKQLGIDRKDAERYIDIYFERYPGVLAYMRRTRQQAQQQGYVETLFGRRLYVPEIKSVNKIRQKAAERMAINAPMQGTAADIIKKAMIDIAVWQKTSLQQPVHMVMQVHDELVFEVPETEIDDVKIRIRDLMEKTVTLNVPLVVSIGVGNNWDEAH